MVCALIDNQRSSISALSEGQGSAFAIRSIGRCPKRGLPAKGLCPLDTYKGTYPLTQLIERFYVMACYHCAVKVLSRSSGRSSVQFSAYISGEKMKDERLGQTFNHTSKEEVCYTEMTFADRVPEQMKSPDTFWNSVEQNEKAKNSQVCRTWEIALPKELTIEQNIDWLQDYVKDLMEKDHMPAVQWAIHDKEGNPHAHIMAPMRDIDDKGKWEAKEKKIYKLDDRGERIPILNPDGTQKTDSRNRKQWERETIQNNPWNSKEFLKTWRERAAEHQNRALEKAGLKERVDHRSYEEQGIERIPTVHEGYQARLMGERSERVQLNEQIRAFNQEYEQQRTLLQQLQQQWQEFIRSVSHVREQIRERIERIGRQAIERGDRADTVGDRKPSTRDIRAEIEHRRTIVRESGADRASRDAERERQRVEASKDAERRQRTRSAVFERERNDFGR